MMRKIAIAAAAACVFAVMSQAAFAEESCSGSGTPLTVDAVKAKLASEGSTKIKEIRTHGGCYEAKGLDNSGKRFEIEVNAYTGDINNKE
jgi:hypothetical protein